MAWCATTALAGAVPWSCVRGARGRFGGVGAGAGCFVFPVSPFLPRVSCDVCVGPSRPGVPYPRSLVRHSMRSVCSAGSVLLPFWYSPGVLCVCVCARAVAASAPPPPAQVGVARAPRAVQVLGAGRALPRGPCPSVCPASVPCSVWLAWGGGRPGFVSPLPGFGAVRSRWGGSARLGRSNAGEWGGGRPARRNPRWCGRGGQWGGGSPYLGPSLWLPSAGNKAGVFGVSLAIEGVAPLPLRFVLACCPQARPVWPPCALARVCLSVAVAAGAGGWGRGGGPCCPPPPPGAAVLLGGGGAVPSALGGVGGRRPRGPVAGQSTTPILRIRDAVLILS